MGQEVNPVDITMAGLAHAKDNGFDTVIVDTAGRQVVDDSLMAELKNIKVGLAYSWLLPLLLSPFLTKAYHAIMKNATIETSLIAKPNNFRGPRCVFGVVSIKFSWPPYHQLFPFSISNKSLGFVWRWES